MKRFLAKAAAFALLQLVIAALLSLRVAPEPHFYAAATIDKHALADSLAGPRLFLVGGSNVAFGVDSEELHKRLGYHPVNLALTAILGLDFILQEVEATARAGDIILLSPEYEHFNGDMTNPAAVSAVVQFRPESSHYVAWSQLKTMLDHGLVDVHEWVRAAFRGRRAEGHDDMAAARARFNRYGDIVFHHREPATFRGVPPRREPLLINGPRVDAVVGQLNAFGDRCRQRNIRVLYAFPPMAESGYANSAALVDYVQQRLKAGLNMPVVHDVRDVVYPDKLFFDTAYHLTQDGKQRRTHLLSARLETAIGIGPESPGPESALGAAPGRDVRTSQRPSATQRR